MKNENDDDRNTFLILIRLNLQGPNPLGQPSSGTQGFPRMEENAEYVLIASLLDTSQQTTRTPLTPIFFNTDERKDIYNGILSNFEDLLESFYNPSDGFVASPGRLNNREQVALERKIGEIGRNIFDLFPRTTHVCDWLDKIFSGQKSSLEHVTIITNDFNIPWYWMKNQAASPMLCEACSLGTLQLVSRSIAEPDDDGAPDTAGKVLRALLINGSGGLDLPFAESQLASLKDFLETGKDLPEIEKLRPFAVDLVAEGTGIRVLRTEEARVLYRLVHYSGHWNYEEMEAVTGKAAGSRDSKKELWIGDKPMNVADLKEFVESAVLALDGCSSSNGLQAWSEIENLTGKILNLGALGCVVTTLPVKDDPIVAEMFWEAFYGNFLRRKGPMTLGRALRKARATLKEKLRKAGLRNSAWAFYQLIGNPSVRLLD